MKYEGFQKITNGTLQATKKPITCIKFGPKGSNLLAAGSEDTDIYIFNIAKGYVLQSKIRDHVAKILYFDFSKDGKTLKSSSTNYDIFYHDTKLGGMIYEGGSLCKDHKWSTI